MRIVDKRKDYYDISLAYGSDNSIVYVRKQKELKITDKTYYLRDSEWLHIGFCGKVYSAFISPIGKSICYSINDLDAIYSGDSVTKQEKQRYFDNMGFTYYYGNRASIKRYFEDAEIKKITQKRYEHLFKEHNCPIFVVDSNQNSIIINCLLRPYEFYRVTDPYTAFQEISMYVGGVLLSPTNPVPDIPDKIMRDIKGFDEWSFKKEPSSPKRKRK